MDGVPLHPALRSDRFVPGGDFAGHQPADDRNRNEDDPAVPIGVTLTQVSLWIEVKEHRPGEGGAEDDRDVGGHADDGIGPGQVRFLDHFGNDAEFGRSEEGALGPHQKENRHHGQNGQIRIDLGQEKRPHPENHHQNFRDFDHEDYPSLGKAIGDGSAQAGKEDEGEGKDPHRHRLGVQGKVFEVHLQGDQQDELLEDVVVKRPKKLGSR